ncbi:hypothetical protein PVAP13_1NG192300 [Panicum virgatum]|uniref:Uncharacterized protein n=1 Tax=Panicum virgatum TaxID=38727 RepID=A0A8T0WSW9_PANVG|nr:hypothetical protein PVAP13_1NG192300 [Panicum virgatum]
MAVIKSKDTRALLTVAVVVMAMVVALSSCPARADAPCQQTRWCKIPACKNWCKSQGYVRGVTCATGPGGYGSCCCLP